MGDPLVIGGQLGNYLIDSVVGRGGMSVVYRAKHARLDMQVALKVLAPELSSDDTFRERFLREAQAAAGIDHPNVIPIHDLGLHGDSLYIVMRYVPGGDLKRLLEESGPLDPDQALALLRPAALALDAAHRHGLVHRDFKPANILIQRSATGELEHVYLTDFGIAKSTVEGDRLTRTGISIGTVGYMAPEQFDGREVSDQTDVYALAATLYECLAGRVPFQRELAEGARPPTGEPIPLSRVRPELPAALDDVIARALARDPLERQATCGELLDGCAAALQGAASTSASATAAVAETVLSEAATARDAPGGPGSEADPPRARPAHADGEAPPLQSAGTAGRGPREHGPRRRLWYAGLAAGVLAAAVAMIVLASGSSQPAGALSGSTLGAVPTNRVTGSGEATVSLSGDHATITVTTNGLDNGAPLAHLVHIHAGGRGECPPASAARLHNGHLTISTTDGIVYYGAPVQALTTHGDTSVASILAFPRYLSGGTLRYKRTIALPASVAAAIRSNDAVVVVHGIDYDGTGIYSGVLDRSELDKQVPGTATAPALCGRLVGSQRSAALGRHGDGAPSAYTASLVVDPAVPSVPGALFVCHAGDAGATGGEHGRGRARVATVGRTSA